MDTALPQSDLTSGWSGVLAGEQHPDHHSIAAFEQRHFPALGRLLMQVRKPV